MISNSCLVILTAPLLPLCLSSWTSGRHRRETWTRLSVVAVITSVSTSAFWQESGTFLLCLGGVCPAIYPTGLPSRPLLGPLVSQASSQFVCILSSFSFFALFFFFALKIGAFLLLLFFQFIFFVFISSDIFAETSLFKDLWTVLPMNRPYFQQVHQWILLNRLDKRKRKANLNIVKVYWPLRTLIVRQS